MSEFLNKIEKIKSSKPYIDYHIPIRMPLRITDA